MNVKWLIWKHNSCRKPLSTKQVPTQSSLKLLGLQTQRRQGHFSLYCSFRQIHLKWVAGREGSLVLFPASIWASVRLHLKLSIKLPGYSVSLTVILKWYNNNNIISINLCMCYYVLYVIIYSQSFVQPLKEHSLFAFSYTALPGEMQCHSNEGEESWGYFSFQKSSLLALHCLI